MKVRRTAPSLTLKSLTVVERAGERVLVVGQRHEGARTEAGVQLEGVLEGAVEAPHADGGVRRAAEDALAVGHRRHRANGVGVPGAGAHEALAGDAPHLDELVIRAADDVLAVGRHRHRAYRVQTVPLEGVDERPVDVVQPDLALLSSALQSRPQSARRRAAPRRSGCRRGRFTSKVRSRAPSSVHSFAVRSSEPLTKRAPPGSTATA